MFRHVRLDEQRGHRRVDPRREQTQRHVAPAGAEELGLVRARDRVVIHDAEDRLRRVLQRHPVLDCTEVVADVQLARRLDAAEDTCHAPNVMSASDASQGIEHNAVTGSSRVRADARALLTTCVAAAARGADVVRKGAERRATLVWETKGYNDFVSEIDRASEATI